MRHCHLECFVDHESHAVRSSGTMRWSTLGRGDAQGLPSVVFVQVSGLLEIPLAWGSQPRRPPDVLRLSIVGRTGVRTLLGALIVLTLAGCGAGQSSSTTADPAPPTSSPTAPEEQPDADRVLAVTAIEANVLGELAAGLEVEEHLPGLLEEDGSTQALVTFTNLGDSDVSMSDFPYFAVAVPAADGSGRLGVAGICGKGWQPDGTPVAEDPCAAASPVAGVPRGESYTLQVNLYPRVEDGEAAPGRYDVSIPLATQSTLEVAYEVHEHDPATLPAWPPESSELTLTLEEIWLENPYRDDPAVDIVVEDPYRRELARREVADIVADWDGTGTPEWIIPLPPGVWNIGVVSHTDDGPQRCRDGRMLVPPDAEERTTVILNIHSDGRC